MLPRLTLPFLALIALLSSGCRISAMYVHPQFNARAPRLVAVLPPSNETDVVLGAKLCHILMARNIGRRHYRAISAGQVSSFLKGQGVSSGGQLGRWDDSGFTWQFPKHLSAKKLCDDLKVDGLVVGHLYGFGEIISGFYNQRKVDIGWALITKDGTCIWMDRKVGFSADVHTDKNAAARAAAFHGIRKIAQNLTETPLYREALMATHNNLKTLPIRVR